MSGNTGGLMETVHMKPYIIISCRHNIRRWWRRRWQLHWAAALMSRQAEEQETEGSRRLEGWRLGKNRQRGRIWKRLDERQEVGCRRNGFGHRGSKWSDTCWEIPHIKVTVGVSRLWRQKQRWLVIDAGCWAQEIDVTPLRRKSCEAEGRCRWQAFDIDDMERQPKAKWNLAFFGWSGK